jgi:nucleoside-diphosphate-sugar epimerase
MRVALEMKVLFIGGTGVISEACSYLAVEKGFELYLLNRGLTDVSLPEEARLIKADIQDGKTVSRLLQNMTFDIVVNWIAFHPGDIKRDLELFKSRISQYIFISSASAYQKPPESYIITEETPLVNPYWEYSRLKIACEVELMQAYHQIGFPVTIVRPSYTYSPRMIPGSVGKGYTLIHRLKQRKKIIVNGDGQSLWTMTHHRDFARGFIGLIGNRQAIGESFHITSDEVLTWDQIYQTIGRAVGVEPDIIHIPSDLINYYDSKTGTGLLGDKAYSAVFDNSKIKRFVPDFKAAISFAEGIRESVAWFEADPARQIINQEADRKMDQIIAVYQRAF